MRSHKLRSRDLRFPWRLKKISKFLGIVGCRPDRAFSSQLAVDSGHQKELPSRKQISREILAQIRDQARHDLLVLSAGDDALASLFQAPRSPMKERFGVDTAALFDGAPKCPRALLIVEDLDDIYAAGIATALKDSGLDPIFTVVTGAGSDAPRSGSAKETLLIHWRDHCIGPSATDARLLACYIHALGSPIVVVSGGLGLRAMARYGAALTHLHRLFCIFAPGTHTVRARYDLNWLLDAASFATVIADSDATAERLRSTYGSFPRGLKVLPLPFFEMHQEIALLFGTAKQDLRPKSDVNAVSRLLARRPGNIDAQPSAPEAKRAPALNRPREVAAKFDVTATVLFHREGKYVVPTLASLADQAQKARDAGLKVELRAVLDSTNEATRKLVALNGGGLDEILEISVGDVGLARNAAVTSARGSFLTILDGDDLWGPDWLRLAYQSATSNEASADAIWHPEDIYMFSEKDYDDTSQPGAPRPPAQSAHFLLQSSEHEWFEHRDLLLENAWNGNAFARTEIYRRFPYQANDWKRRWGIEDWRWNLLTLSGGVAHRIVADTVQIYRIKATHSLDVQTFAQGLLPVIADEAQ